MGLLAVMGAIENRKREDAIRHAQQEADAMAAVRRDLDRMLMDSLED